MRVLAPWVLGALGSLGLAAGAGADRDEPTPYERTTPRAEVAVRDGAGDERIDVTATRVSIGALLERVARASGRQVEGLDVLSRDPEVTAKLEDEDLRDALRYIGGSVGLAITVSSSHITVEEDLPPYPRRSDLYERAATDYLRALIHHPESEFAPGAAWNRACIEEATPGRELEAARTFDDLVRNHPDADLVPDALLRAGVMFGRAGAWEEAVTRFDQLASYPTQHPHAREARRLLADAHTRVADQAQNDVVRLENARRALFVLESLDDRFPTPEPAARRLRYLVRSRAHSLADEPVHALRALDLAVRHGGASIDDAEIAELRARALERAERHGEAVRAWLEHGRLVEGDARVTAYRRAAEVANRGREHLAAIAIAKAARNQGFGDELAPAADEAWMALDMEARRLDLFGDAEKITRGERLLDKGMDGEAARALGPVFDRRAALGREDRARLGRAYATALMRGGELDRAQHVLRETAREQEKPAARREIYLFAAELLETAGELERAIAALEGRL